MRIPTLSPGAKILGLFVIIIAGATLGLWYLSAPSAAPTQDDEILSRNGLHWHSDLSIIIKGEKQGIPKDIGIGTTIHQSVHTHDADGVIHLEFPGVVNKSDTTLGAFFRIWGKTFDQDCIFENCNGAEGTVKFFVNGVENTEWEKYHMQDNDKIEIRYE